MPLRRVFDMSAKASSGFAMPNGIWADDASTAFVKIEALGDCDIDVIAAAFALWAVSLRRVPIPTRTTVSYACAVSPEFISWSASTPVGTAEGRFRVEQEVEEAEPEPKKWY